MERPVGGIRALATNIETSTVRLERESIVTISNEEIVANCMYRFTNRYCKKYAPSDACYEYKYTKIEALNVVLKIINDVLSGSENEINLILNELNNSTSDIFWGHVDEKTREDLIKYIDENNPKYRELVRTII